MKKSYLSLLVTTLLVVVIIASCTKSDRTGVLSNQRQEPIADKIKEQLKLAQANLSAKQLPAKIVAYNFESALVNDDQVTAIKKQLIAGADVVPQFNGTDAASFSVNTIQERMAAYAKDSRTEQNVVDNIQQIAFPQIQKGQKVLDILWELNGQQFHSKCIYNDDGVVYDNMLSNISLVDAIAPEESIKPSAGNGDRIANATSSARTQYSFTATVLNYTIKWLWGSTRGKIIIKHYIIWNGYNYIYDHGGSEDAWMSVGSASAKWHNNYLNRRSRSKMAWAYGWATPTASFSITYHSSSLTFSTSTGGIGSRGSGSGIHTIYLP